MKKQSDLSKLFDYAGNYKYLTISSWILSAISALVGLLPFYYIWKLIKEVLDVAPNYEQAENLTHNGWMAFLFAIVSILIYVGGLICSHFAAFRIQANIRSRAMHHVTKLSMGFMDGVGSGKMRKIIHESSEATETYLAHQLPDRAGAIATPIGLLIMLVIFDWKLGLLSLIPVVLGFLIALTMMGPSMQKRMKQYEDSLENMSNESVEYVRGIPVVKTFGQSVFSFKRFKAAIDNYERFVISYTKDVRFSMLCYTTVINGFFAILIAAALVMTKDVVTNEFLLNLLFYIIATPILTVTMNKILYSSENRMVVADAMNRIDGIMNLKPLKEPKVSKSPKENSVELLKASFRYPDAKENAINNVSLKINSGEHVAFVGPSGGGKSTLASLISRFWDVNSGEIKIGGVNVKDISKDELMKYVSFVFQDSKLLKTSILENVRMAKPDATREEVLKALKLAQCDDIIEKMPNGIDTVIGAKGVYLSGGEQQRISIARVILKNSPILILDEATAFADPDNEVKVQAAFSELSKGKTVIMIAHRLSTVVNTDRIFVLKNGEILESGSHDNLLKNEAMYAHMWQEYNRATKWKVGAKNG